MTDDEYLKKLLRQQELGNESAELAQLEHHRNDVEGLLMKEFGDSATLREGGSKAKTTMIKDAYDLDFLYYFSRDDDTAGETIKEIFENIEKALQKKYRTVRKGVAVRLLDCDSDEDFHIDVVPGRFIDGDDGDAFLYPSSTNKERLQTNLDVHITYVKNSGVIDAIRLMKLWKARRNISLKTFALELLTINCLKHKKKVSLSDQLGHVLAEFRDNMKNLTIEDPANSNNDLSGMLTDAIRTSLTTQASETLHLVDDTGWEAVLGKVVADKAKDATTDALLRIAVGAAPTRPWCRGS